MGSRQGKGRIEWPSGTYYEGDWYQDKKHGVGTLETVKVFKYTGDWNLGSKQGQGMGTWYNQDTGQISSQYEGTWN